MKERPPRLDPRWRTATEGVAASFAVRRRRVSLPGSGVVPEGEGTKGGWGWPVAVARWVRWAGGGGDAPWKVGGE